MPNFLDACKEYYGSDNLYDVLSLDKTASNDDIKKAYRKLSLKVHPDRVEEDHKEIATEKFKILSKIHAILSDKDKRACYDETGCVDDDDSIAMDRDWTEYWRLLFKKITDDDIKNYEASYRGGSEEKKDLISAYQKFKGDIDVILDHVPFSHPHDVPRFQDILRPLIESEELPRYEKFLNDNPKKQAARKRKYKLEEKRVEKIQKENEKNGKEVVDAESSAIKAIMQRQKEREVEEQVFFKYLEEKYSKPKNKLRSRKK